MVALSGESWRAAERAAYARARIGGAARARTADERRDGGDHPIDGSVGSEYAANLRSHCAIPQVRD